MCGCPAHHELVDCTCQCDHSGDRLSQWIARARKAERALQRVQDVADEWGEPFHCGWLSASVLVRQLRAALEDPGAVLRKPNGDLPGAAPWPVAEESRCQATIGPTGGAGFYVGPDACGLTSGHEGNHHGYVLDSYWGDEHDRARKDPNGGS